MWWPDCCWCPFSHFFSILCLRRSCIRWTYLALFFRPRTVLVILGTLELICLNDGCSPIFCLEIACIWTLWVLLSRETKIEWTSLDKVVCAKIVSHISGKRLLFFIKELASSKKLFVLFCLPWQANFMSQQARHSSLASFVMWLHQDICHFWPLPKVWSFVWMFYLGSSL